MKTIIGTMSGTSMDGIDVALLETDGEDIGAVGQTYFQAYSKREREQIVRAKRAYRENGRNAGEVIMAEAMVTTAHARAIKALLSQAALRAEAIDLIGFHGQTIYHAPQENRTVQLGDGAALANDTGIIVACDFRKADIAAGGEGAPLVPVFHQAVLKNVEQQSAIVNIGGVANLTIVTPQGLIAFDTGPGNALIDEWIRSRTSRLYDEWGRIAGEGTIHEGVVKTFFSHPHFDRPPPKSLDRDAFDDETYWRAIDRLSLADGAATLTAVSARSIVKAFERYPVKSLYVSGGGAKNRTMLKMMTDHSSIALHDMDTLGFDGDFLEALAFAYLAARVERALPLTFPGTTGVSVPLSGGILCAPQH